MNRVIQGTNLRFVKLCIVSAYYEIIVNLAYIIFFFMLAFYVLSTGGRLSNYKTIQLANEIFKKDLVMSIKDEHALMNYIDEIVKVLYEYDSVKDFKTMIPFGSIRLKKFSQKASNCDIDFAKKCSDYKCTVEELNRIYGKGSLCGYPYKKDYGVSTTKPLVGIHSQLTRDFEGRYATYNLVNDGQDYDFTIDEYTPQKTAIEAYIKDKDLNFLAVRFNVYFPMNDNYIHIIAGVEMVNLFTFTQPIFSAIVYNHFNPNGAYFLTIYIFFVIAVALNIIKLLFEINIKFMPSIHLLSFLNEAINLLFIIFLSFYCTSVAKDPYLFTFSNEKQFIEVMPTIVLHSYNQLIISVLFLCMPFRFLSLISWQQGSIHLVKYFSVIFRILPGVLILGFIMILVLIVFSCINFFLYNSKIFLCKNVFHSLIMVFNFNQIRDINLSNVLNHSISHSEYFLLYNVIQMLVFGVTFSIGIATFVYLFRKGATIEQDKENDEVALRLDEIDQKLSSEVQQCDTNFHKMVKQILWLNLSGRNNIYKSFEEKQRVVLFIQAQQVISFLKYLFALKPEMQFKNLDDKFNIIIESSGTDGKIKDSELDHIDILLDWLSFVGCKIPVMLYSPEKLDKNTRMRIASCYLFMRFISQKKDLKNFLENCIDKTKEEEEATKARKVDPNQIIDKGDRFMIHRTKAVMNTNNIGGYCIGPGAGDSSAEDSSNVLGNLKKNYSSIMKGKNRGVIEEEESEVKPKSKTVNINTKASGSSKYKAKTPSTSVVRSFGNSLFGKKKSIKRLSASNTNTIKEERYVDNDIQKLLNK